MKDGAVMKVKLSLKKGDQEVKKTFGWSSFRVRFLHKQLKTLWKFLIPTGFMIFRGFSSVRCMSASHLHSCTSRCFQLSYSLCSWLTTFLNEAFKSCKKLLLNLVSHLNWNGQVADYKLQLYNFHWCSNLNHPLRQTTAFISTDTFLSPCGRIKPTAGWTCWDPEFVPWERGLHLRPGSFQRGQTGGGSRQADVMSVCTFLPQLAETPVQQSQDKAHEYGLDRLQYGWLQGGGGGG